MTVTQFFDIEGYPDHIWGDVPVMHELRETQSSLWVRFHTLPGGKRLDVGDTAQFARALARTCRIWAAVQRIVAPTGWKAVGVHCEQDDDESPYSPVKAHWDNWFTPSATQWRTRTIHEMVPAEPPAEGFEPYTRHEEYWIADVGHDTAYFADYVRNQALHERYRHSLMHVEAQALFYSYHSGVDVICTTTRQRAALAAEFADLLPTTPSGM